MSLNLHHEERHLRSLQDFESEVASDPTNAQVFATNDFLDVLSSLIKDAYDQTAETSDYDDNYESEIELLKSAIRAFATVVPYVFSSVYVPLMIPNFLEIITHCYTYIIDARMKPRLDCGRMWLLLNPLLWTP